MYRMRPDEHFLTGLHATLKGHLKDITACELYRQMSTMSNTLVLYWGRGTSVHYHYVKDIEMMDSLDLEELMETILGTAEFLRDPGNDVHTTFLAASQLNISF